MRCHLPPRVRSVAPALACSVWCLLRTMGMVDLSVGSFINESTTPPSGPEGEALLLGADGAHDLPMRRTGRLGLPGGSQPMHWAGQLFAGFEAKAKSPGDFPQGLVIIQGELGHRYLPPV